MPLLYSGLSRNISRFGDSFSEKSHFSDRYLLLTEKYAIMLPVRGCSSAGRALRSQRRGQGFDPLQVHQNKSAFAALLFLSEGSERSGSE